MSSPPTFPQAASSDPSHTAENQWRTALERSGAGTWDWDLASDKLTHSARCERMLGYAGSELTQQHPDFASLMHPQDRDALESTLAQCMDGTRDHFTHELRLRRRDGQWLWALCNGSVISRNASGRPLRLLGTLTDISERKSAEAELRAQSLLLRDTMDSISQGIFVFDALGHVISFNNQACRLLELDAEFLRSRPSLKEINTLQLARGDFGAQARNVERHARDYVLGHGVSPAPTQYLRSTRAGRTLEVKSQILPEGGMVRTFADVSDYVQAQAARDRLDKLLVVTQAMAQVGGWEVDVVADRVFWTEGVYRILEVATQDYTPGGAMDTAARFLTPESMLQVRASYQDTENQPATHDMELEAITARGRRIWLRVTGTAQWQDKVLLARTSVIQNITENKMAQEALLEAESRWKLALESTGDGVWDWRIPEGAEFYSKRLIEMYGYSEGDLQSDPKALDSRTHPDDLAQMERDRAAHFEGRIPTYMNEHRVRCKNGNWKWVLTRGMVISRDAQGRPLRMIGTHTDITERKNDEAMIRQQAFFDTLTGLPNRRMLRDRLEQEIRRCKRDQRKLAVLFIDLDHFKEVNDTLGHSSGDELLIEAGRRIKECVREADTVARMGGDEFTVILTEVERSEELEPLLQKILHAMDAVFQLGDEQIFVSASIGITIYPDDGEEIDDLLKSADQALYVAKGEGRNRFSFFTPALQAAVQTRVRLASDLRTALREGQFRVVYQPIVDLHNGQVHKAEALIRWQHPKRGLVSPAAFIPIAESSGLIVDIGEWVFMQAAQQVQAWRASLHPDFQISVNRSPVQFHHEQAGQATWGLQLQAMGLPGSAVVVEITEGLLLDSGDQVGEQLLAFGDAGIQVSLDDFGTGYSSLAYLQKFDIDYIKIDQSFVRHLINGSTDLALCKAIIVMAHELGIKVIAEGVETAQQRALLQAAGCDYAQGYLFDRPMAAADFQARYQPGSAA